MAFFLSYKRLGAFIRNLFAAFFSLLFSRKKTKESNSRREPKCNIQKQRLLQPSHDNTDDSMPDVQYATKRNSERDVAHTRDGHKILKKVFIHFT